MVQLLLILSALFMMFSVLIGGTAIGFGFLLSTIWLSWLQESGSKNLLYRIENHINFPTLKEKQNLWAFGFTMIIFGIVIFGATYYLNVGPIMTELFIILSIISIFQIGLPLMFIFFLKNFSLFIGFLSTSIILHSLTITKPNIFYNISNTGNFFPKSTSSITFVKVAILLYLMVSMWFLARSIFITPNNQINYDEEQLSKDINLKLLLRNRGNYIRFISYIFGAIITFVELFNLMYDLYNTK